jgi:hypothetical protein
VNLAAHYTGDMGMMRANRRVLIGVGVSIAVHLLLMFAYRNTEPALPAFVPEPPSSIAVRILPPPPPPPPRQAEPAPPAPSAAKAARSARRSTPKSVIAVPASPEQDAFTVEQAAEPAPTPGEAPKFDVNAAKQTARELAGRTKLGIEGTALAQFPDPPLETETKAARAISKAKRANCKDGIPGGLLAPLFLMMDKKDHGCKW